MELSTPLKAKPNRKFPAFNLERLLENSFHPKPGERVCILIDLKNPEDVIGFNFLRQSGCAIQHKAHSKFYQPIREELMKKFKFKACDFYAYKITGGSNLELPKKAISPEGKHVTFEEDIYPNYDLILCISTYSAAAPLTAKAKEYGFRGATMHGINDIILQSGLAVDYNDLSAETEKLRLGMTLADHVDINFEVDGRPYHLNIELGRQEAQKSHGICADGSDIANLPAGEVYFVPTGAKGDFPLKFDDGTIGIMHVKDGRVQEATLLRGNSSTVEAFRAKLKEDPAVGILGELGFGTQVFPFSGSDIQDEKIFGTFHIATGRNDHLNGSVTGKAFTNPLNATHDDILFSSTKTPEIHVKQVRMQRKGKNEILIEHYEPSEYLWELIK
jgi:aminopeptidase